MAPFVSLCESITSALTWESIPVIFPVFLLDCKCVISPVCPLVHSVKSTPADGHVPLNQHTDKWKTLNLNGLVKLAWVLIAYQASGCSSCHREKNGPLCQSAGSKLAACPLGMWRQRVCTCSYIHTHTQMHTPIPPPPHTHTGAVGQCWEPVHQLSLRP